MDTLELKYDNNFGVEGVTARIWRDAQEGAAGAKINAKNEKDTHSVYNALNGTYHFTETTVVGMEPVPKNFTGEIYLDGITTGQDLTTLLANNFQGRIVLDGLTSAKDLIIPTNFKGTIGLDGLKTIDGLVLPENFQGAIGVPYRLVEPLQGKYPAHKDKIKLY